VPFCAARRYPSDVVDAVVGTGQFILDRHTELKFFPPRALRKVITNPAVAVDTKRRTGRSLTFGYLGRLTPLKGVEVLIRAFAKRNDDDWQLLIAGAGAPEYVGHLQKLASKACRPAQIRFLGWTDSAEFLRCVDVVVVPSLWHEPLSRSAIEAHVSGIAVVASRRGGLSEIVEDGVTGVLFEPDEDGSLEHVIDVLLAHPDQVRLYGDAARARADRFRPDVVAAQYMRAYEEVLANRSRTQASS
jgi:glycosyltransferase involved in cell wall biosynthesis